MTDLQKADESSVTRQTLTKKKAITLQTLKPQALTKGTVLLADISGSMTGGKMRELIDALSSVWNPDMQGVAFNHQLYELTEDDIPFMKSSGTTAMLDALNEAWSRKPKHIILMTDGYPDGGTEEVLGAVRFNTGTPIDTVGIADSAGCGYDPKFLWEIASLTGGRFIDVNEPLELTQTLQFLLTYTPDGIQAPQEGVIEL